MASYLFPSLNEVREIADTDREAAETKWDAVPVGADGTVEMFYPNEKVISKIPLAEFKAAQVNYGARPYTAALRKYKNPLDAPEFSGHNTATGDDDLEPMAAQGFRDRFPNWIGPEPKAPESLNNWDRYNKLIGLGKQGRAGFVEQLTPTAEDIPFAGLAVTTINLSKVSGVVKKLKAGQAVSDQELLDVNLFLTEADRDASASTLGKVGSIIRQSVSFGGELAATGGGMAFVKIAGKTGYEGIELAVRKAVKDYMIKTLGARAARAAGVAGATSAGVTRAASLTAGAAGHLSRMAAAGGVNTVVKQAVSGIAGAAAGLEEGMAATPQAYTRQIYGDLTGDPESYLKSFTMGTIQNFVENSSEFSGAGLRALAKLGTKSVASTAAGKYIGTNLRNQILAGSKEILEKYGKGMTSEFKAQLQNKMLGRALITTMGWAESAAKKIPFDKAVKALARGGYDGPIEEWGEERVAGFMHGLFGTEGDTAGLRSALKNMWPTSEDAVAEILAFSAPVAYVKGMQSLNLGTLGLLNKGLSQAEAAVDILAKRQDVAAQNDAEYRAKIQPLVDQISRSAQTEDTLATKTINFLTKVATLPFTFDLPGLAFNSTDTLLAYKLGEKMVQGFRNVKAQAASQPNSTDASAEAAAREDVISRFKIYRNHVVTFDEATQAEHKKLTDDLQKAGALVSQDLMPLMLDVDKAKSVFDAALAAGLTLDTVGQTKEILAKQGVIPVLFARDAATIAKEGNRPSALGLSMTADDFVDVTEEGSDMVSRIAFTLSTNANSAIGLSPRDPNYSKVFDRYYRIQNRLIRHAKDGTRVRVGDVFSSKSTGSNEVAVVVRITPQGYLTQKYTVPGDKTDIKDVLAAANTMMGEARRGNNQFTAHTISQADQANWEKVTIDTVIPHVGGVVVGSLDMLDEYMKATGNRYYDRAWLAKNAERLSEEGPAGETQYRIKYAGYHPTAYSTAFDVSTGPWHSAHEDIESRLLWYGQGAVPQLFLTDVLPKVAKHLGERGHGAEASRLGKAVKDLDSGSMMEWVVRLVGMRLGYGSRRYGFIEKSVAAQVALLEQKEGGESEDALKEILGDDLYAKVDELMAAVYGADWLPELQNPFYDWTATGAGEVTAPVRAQGRTSAPTKVTATADNRLVDVQPADPHATEATGAAAAESETEKRERAITEAVAAEHAKLIEGIAARFEGDAQLLGRISAEFAAKGAGKQDESVKAVLIEESPDAFNLLTADEQADLIKRVRATWAKYVDAERAKAKPAAAPAENPPAAPAAPEADAAAADEAAAAAALEAEVNAWVMPSAYKDAKVVEGNLPVAGQKGVRRGARFVRAANTILIDPEGMRQAYSRYVRGAYLLDGIKPVEGLTPFSKFADFVMEHEYQHKVLGARPDGESEADYENRVNVAAIAALAAAAAPAPAENPPAPLVPPAPIVPLGRPPTSENPPPAAAPVVKVAHGIIQVEAPEGATVVEQDIGAAPIANPADIARKFNQNLSVVGSQPPSDAAPKRAVAEGQGDREPFPEYPDTGIKTLISLMGHPVYARWSERGYRDTRPTLADPKLRKAAMALRLLGPAGDLGIPKLNHGLWQNLEEMAGPGYTPRTGVYLDALLGTPEFDALLALTRLPGYSDWRQGADPRMAEPTGDLRMAAAGRMDDWARELANLMKSWLDSGDTTAPAEQFSVIGANVEKEDLVRRVYPMFYGAGVAPSNRNVWNILQRYFRVNRDGIRELKNRKNINSVPEYADVTQELMDAVSKDRPVRLGPNATKALSEYLDKYGYMESGSGLYWPLGVEEELPDTDDEDSNDATEATAGSNDRMFAEADDKMKDAVARDVLTGLTAWVVSMTLKGSSESAHAVAQRILFEEFRPAMQEYLQAAEKALQNPDDATIRLDPNFWDEASFTAWVRQPDVSDNSAIIRMAMGLMGYKAGRESMLHYRSQFEVDLREYVREYAGDTKKITTRLQQIGALDMFNTFAKTLETRLAERLAGDLPAILSAPVYRGEYTPSPGIPAKAIADYLKWWDSNLIQIGETLKTARRTKAIAATEKDEAKKAEWLAASAKAEAQFRQDMAELAAYISGVHVDYWMQIANNPPARAYADPIEQLRLALFGGSFAKYLDGGAEPAGGGGKFEPQWANAGISGMLGKIYKDSVDLPEEDRKAIAARRQENPLQRRVEVASTLAKLGKKDKTADEKTHLDALLIRNFRGWVTALANDVVKDVPLATRETAVYAKSPLENLGASVRFTGSANAPVPSRTTVKSPTNESTISSRMWLTPAVIGLLRAAWSGKYRYFGANSKVILVTGLRDNVGKRHQDMKKMGSRLRRKLAIEFLEGSNGTKFFLPFLAGDKSKLMGIEVDLPDNLRMKSGESAEDSYKRIWKSLRPEFDSIVLGDYKDYKKGTIDANKRASPTMTPGRLAGHFSDGLPAVYYVAAFKSEYSYEEYQKLRGTPLWTDLSTVPNITPKTKIAIADGQMSVVDENGRLLASNSFSYSPDDTSTLKLLQARRGLLIKANTVNYADAVRDSGTALGSFIKQAQDHNAAHPDRKLVMVGGEGSLKVGAGLLSEPGKIVPIAVSLADTALVSELNSSNVLHRINVPSQAPSDMLSSSPDKANAVVQAIELMTRASIAEAGNEPQSDLSEDLPATAESARNMLLNGASPNSPMLLGVNESARGSAVGRTVGVKAPGVKLINVDAFGSNRVRDYSRGPNGELILGQVYAHIEGDAARYNQYRDVNAGESAPAAEARVRQEFLAWINEGDNYTKVADLLTTPTLLAFRDGTRQPGALTEADIRGWEIRVDPSNAARVVIPGSFFVINRTPGTGFESHFVARLGDDPGAKFGNMLMVHPAIMLRAGVDNDGDSWSVFAVSKPLSAEGARGAMTGFWLHYIAAIESLTDKQLYAKIDLDKFKQDHAYVAEAVARVQDALAKSTPADPEQQERMYELIQEARNLIGGVVATVRTFQLAFRVGGMRINKFTLPWRKGAGLMPFAGRGCDTTKVLNMRVGPREFLTIGREIPTGAMVANVDGWWQSDAFIKVLTGMLTNVIIDNAKDPQVSEFGLVKETSGLFMAALLFPGAPLVSEEAANAHFDKIGRWLSTPMMVEYRNALKDWNDPTFDRPKGKTKKFFIRDRILPVALKAAPALLTEKEAADAALVKSVAERQVASLEALSKASEEMFVVSRFFGFGTKAGASTRSLEEFLEAMDAHHKVVNNELKVFQHQWPKDSMPATAATAEARLAEYDKRVYSRAAGHPFAESGSVRAWLSQARFRINALAEAIGATAEENETTGKKYTQVIEGSAFALLGEVRSPFDRMLTDLILIQKRDFADTVSSRAEIRFSKNRLYQAWLIETLVRDSEMWPADAFPKGVDLAKMSQKVSHLLGLMKLDPRNAGNTFLATLSSSTDSLVWGHPARRITSSVRDFRNLSEQDAAKMTADAEAMVTPTAGSEAESQWTTPQFLHALATLSAWQNETVDEMKDGNIIPILPRSVMERISARSIESAKDFVTDLTKLSVAVGDTLETRRVGSGDEVMDPLQHQRAISALAYAFTFRKMSGMDEVKLGRSDRYIPGAVYGQPSALHRSIELRKSKGTSSMETVPGEVYSVIGESSPEYIRLERQGAAYAGLDEVPRALLTAQGSTVAINRAVFNVGSNGVANMTVEDVLNYPALLKAYPALATEKVVVGKENPGADTFWLPIDLSAVDLDDPGKWIDANPEVEAAEPYLRTFMLAQVQRWINNREGITDVAHPLAFSMPPKDLSDIGSDFASGDYGGLEKSPEAMKALKYLFVQQAALQKEARAMAVPAAETEEAPRRRFRWTPGNFVNTAGFIRAEQVHPDEVNGVVQPADQVEAERRAFQKEFNVRWKGVGNRIMKAYDAGNVQRAHDLAEQLVFNTKSAPEILKYGMREVLGRRPPAGVNMTLQDVLDADAHSWAQGELPLDAKRVEFTSLSVINHQEWFRNFLLNSGSQGQVKLHQMLLDEGDRMHASRVALLQRYNHYVRVLGLDGRLRDASLRGSKGRKMTDDEILMQRQYTWAITAMLEHEGTQANPYPVERILADAVLTPAQKREQIEALLGSIKITWGHKLKTMGADGRPVTVAEAQETVATFLSRWKRSAIAHELIARELAADQAAGTTPLAELPSRLDWFGMLTEVKGVYNELADRLGVARVQGYAGQHGYGFGFMDAYVSAAEDKVRKSMARMRKPNPHETWFVGHETGVELQNNFAKHEVPGITAFQKDMLKLLDDTLTDADFAGMTAWDANHAIRTALFLRQVHRAQEEGDTYRADADPENAKDLKTIKLLNGLLRNYKFREWTGRQMTRRVKGSFESVFTNPKYRQKSQMNPQGLPYRPRTMDFTVLMKRYADEALAAVMNQNLVRSFLLTQDMDGTPMVLAIPSAFEDKRPLIPDALYREMGRRLAAYHGKAYNATADLTEGTETLVNTLVGSDASYVRMESPFPSVKAFYVKKGQAARLMKHLIQQPARLQVGDYDVLEVLGNITQWSKVTSVGYSLFFPWALMESVIAGTGFARNILWSPREFAKDFKRIRNQIETGDATLRMELDLMAQAGMRLESAAAIGESMDVVGKGIEAAAEKARLLGGDAWAKAVSEGLNVMSGRWLSQVFFGKPGESAGWFPTIKVWTAFHLAKEAADANGATFEFLTPQEKLKIYKAIGPFVDAAIGGENWARYPGATPRVMQFANLTVFAPSWTMAAIQQSGLGFLLAPFTGYIPSPETRALIMRNWAVMATIMLVAIPNMLQSAIWAGALLGGAGDDDDNPFTFMNEKGRKTYVDITPLARLINPAYKGDPTGKRRVYARWGKQSYEVLDGWLAEPIAQLMRKLSNPAKIVLEQVTGKSPGSDWNLEFSGQGFRGWLVAEDSDGSESFLKSRFGYAAQKFLPMSLLSLAENPGALPMNLFAPVSKGASAGKVTADLVQILNTYADATSWKQIKLNPRARANLDALAPALLESARVNGYDTDKIVKSAKGVVLGRLYKSFFAALNNNDTARMNVLSRQILRVGGALKGAMASMKNRVAAYSKELTPEEVAAIQDAFAANE